MRFAVNAHLLSFGQNYRGAGISRYILNLVAHLPDALGGDSATIFLGDRRLPSNLAKLPLDYSFSRIPTARPQARILWEQLVAPLACARAGVQLLHSTAYVQPLLCPTRSVVTIHDLSFILMPETFKRGNQLYLSALTRISARRADRVIAVSENTRQDVIRLLGVTPSKVEVVHHGIEPEFRPIEPSVVEGFRRRRGLPDRYVLHLGTLEPRKNLPTLLRAFAQARREYGLSHELVLGGGKGWGYQQIFDLVDSLGLKGKVHFPGFVPLAELPLWYNGASLFAYPSRYEGFGMPPLEAMACGTPVLTSSRSSLPEVLGGAGLLVDPDSVPALADELGRVLGDEARLADLRERGLRRAATFSWNETARRTVRIYRQAAGGRLSSTADAAESSHAPNGEQTEALDR